MKKNSSFRKATMSDADKIQAVTEFFVVVTLFGSIIIALLTAILFTMLGGKSRV
jgi:hypothetical protein